MKKTLLTLAFAVILIGCKNEEAKQLPINEPATAENVATDLEYHSLGEKITDKEVISSEELLEKYKTLKAGDTLNLKFAGQIKEVCQKKGCWMKVDLGEKDAMVTFKDYGFFMPKDLQDKNVIMEGKAYVEEMSVEDQRHYAEDGGATPEEALAITEPKKTYSFKAHGVLIPELQKQ